jgi:hypothetical protein
VVHRITYNFSHFLSLLVVLFINFILDIDKKKKCYYPVKQLDHFLVKIKQSRALPHIFLVRECSLTGLLALLSTANRLKPSGFCAYHQVEHSEILHGTRFALSVLYGSQNRQRLLLYTSLPD